MELSPGDPWPGWGGDARRGGVIGETHARPPVPFRSPATATLLVFLSREGSDAEDRAAFLKLVDAAGAGDDVKAPLHSVVRLGRTKLKWERHTEFCSYLFIQPGEPEPLPLPSGWRAAQLDRLLVAARFSFHEVLDGAVSASRARVAAPQWGAVIETDLLMGSDGFVGYRVEIAPGREERAGRLLQLLADIETYRTMAMLAAPELRPVGASVAGLDNTSAALVARVAGGSGSDTELLEELGRLAAEGERIAASSRFRVTAGRAYYDIVAERFAELGEERIEGSETLSRLVGRRLGPAVRSGEAILARLDLVTERLGRAGALLRTRVDIELERQNQSLLRSMDRRAEHQGRIERIVERLSVVAVAYYGAALVKLVAEGVLPPGGKIASIVAAVAGLLFALVAVVLLRRATATADQD